jgi:poly(hydroxyalkanoate) depolymerase family esterase
MEAGFGSEWGCPMGFPTEGRAMFDGLKIKQTDARHTGPSWLKFVPAEVRGLVEAHLPAGLPDFASYASPERGPLPFADAHPVAVPAGAHFLAGSFSNEAGTRPYKLYVPSGYHGHPVPLIVMLHGCTQSPDDFAAGTAMNGVAEEQTCLVVYPGQTVSAHGQKCWKWFSADDQQRGKGEPLLIAGLTRQIMRDYAIDPTRVYVAGLSAGGATAAIMGETYPDLYAAIGVHSGLACGAASSLPTAFAAMAQGGAGRLGGRSASGVERRFVPTIVFHGDNDATVSPRNGEEVVAQVAQDAVLRMRVQKGRVPGGHAYTRTIHADQAGASIIELWVIHGAGHAWCGGSPKGSYTDQRGPDATREMMRFFCEHPHPKPAASV